MKKSEVAELVVVLFSAFPNAKVTEETNAAYERYLEDLDRERASAAVQRLIGTSRFLPSIAEIREAAAGVVLGPVRSGSEAWGDALEAVRRVGWCGNPRFKDPLVKEALRLWGGWQEFCASPEDDPGGRARFIDLYDQLARRERNDSASAVKLPTPKGGMLGE